MIKRGRRRKQTTGWTTVTTRKPHKRFEWVTVSIPEDVTETLNNLERNVLFFMSDGKSRTVDDLLELIGVQQVTRKHINDIMHNSPLRTYVETEDWNARPRLWRLKKVKAPATTK